MDPSSLFKSLVVVESTEATPSRSQSRGDSISIHTAPQLPEKPTRTLSRANTALNVNIDLHDLTNAKTSPPSFPGGTTTPLELESCPQTPHNQDAAEVVQTVWEPHMNRWRMAAVCCMIFTDGIHDSCAGPLIPYMETDYDIEYGTVSLIFVGAAIGFVLAASLLDVLRHKLGRARVISLSTIIHLLGFLGVALRPPFPVVVVAYAFIGMGSALNIAFSNLFCGSLANATTVLGGMHGSYGIGGTVGPLAATAMAGSGINWSKYYFIGVGMSIVNFCIATWSFWGADDDGTSGGGGHETLVERLEEMDSGVGGKLGGLLAALKSMVVLLGSLFIFSYQGAEVSISGWVVSFLINVRGGDPASVGYVTSGFWAGITIGRFLLANPAQRIGEKLFIYIVTVASVVFELLVWLVPNLIGNAVAVGIIGLLLGPVAPCSAAVFMKILGRKERVSGMGIISAFGSSGGAVAPFTTGLLAQAKGTWVMHPVVIGLLGAMLACWFGLPKLGKRRE
ncbi:Bypass of stop codon protein 6 [Zalerion maritima]|uniref:Bypass of stop codon protein 6 n=1 Tax=Zalerion maritima TaxID=339359 RepID=A0AAD5RYC9_9PEZI|nr:Bypass of stop codon protein 6 [Zalerion maritima]